jgi:ribosome-associated protein
VQEGEEAISLALAEGEGLHAVVHLFRVLDLREITPVFDYFVIATGSSRRQLHAMADEIESVLKKEHHDKKRGAEGYEEGRWIVLDYGDVMVHLFDAEARLYWDIEHLWSDAARVTVPTAGAGSR